MMTEEKNEEEKAASGYDKVGVMVAAFYHAMIAKGVPEPLAENLTEIMLVGLVEQIGQGVRGKADFGPLLNVGAKGG